MSGVRRFLSRRDKSPAPHAASQHHRTSHSRGRITVQQPELFAGVFVLSSDQRRPDKEEEKTIKGILERFRHYGINRLTESNVQYALQACMPKGDPQAAFQLLMLLEDTHEGIVSPYNPDVKMRGAVNRQGVTCFLDALLFAMFAKLDSFEAMLYDSFEDVKRKRLASMLRLWVNLLRTGNLILPDVTEQVQLALADLGWLEASRLMQQDPSEAFTFITGQLELPMLTLKMDMFHTGREDPQDDHKFINERLLEVAILDQPAQGASVITLEDCLEHYFNNRIEVKRHLENQRRNTLKTISGEPPATKLEKDHSTYVEVVDLGPGTPSGSTPLATPVMESPIAPHLPQGRLRPLHMRKRGDSIFSQRKVELTGVDPDTLKAGDDEAVVDGTGRKLSTRTEVLMPAWQFYKLLPWYTDNMPTSDAQVAAHFAKQRPVLGICLKRYSYTPTGQAQRLDTYVDIPLEIAVPNFVGDDNMGEEGPLVGNFRLMLQSVVCHRGVSVNSGHYICLCRATKPTLASRLADAIPLQNDEDDESDDPWVRFDDLAPNRTEFVNIRQALRDETPYLLFYQVTPIGDDGHSIHDLPSYEEATSRSLSESAAVVEKPYLHEVPESDDVLEHSASDPAVHATTEVNDFAPLSTRTSIDANAAPFLQDANGRRRSIALDGSSFTDSVSGGSVRTDPLSNSMPSTPSEEKTGSSLLSVANKFSTTRRSSRTSRSTARAASNVKSRPPSAGPDASTSGNRFSLNMTRLTQRASRSDPSHPDRDLPVSGSAESVTGGSLPSAPPPAPTSRTDTASTVHSTLAGPSSSSRPTQDKDGDKTAVRPERRRLGKSHEERDCVVM